MGIEFAYAAETAFVSPTLLKIGKLLTRQTKSKAKAYLPLANTCIRISRIFRF